MQTIKAIIAKIDGNKTYILATALAVTQLLVAFEAITPQTGQWISGLLAGGGYATMRHAISKSKS